MEDKVSELFVTTSWTTHGPGTIYDLSLSDPPLGRNVPPTPVPKL